MDKATSIPTPAASVEVERLAAQAAPTELKDSASQLRKVLGISQDFSDWPYAKLMDAATKHILSTFDKPEEFTQGVNAAAKMLDKMADDYSNEHAVQDPDTGVYEFGRGGKEDYYNTLRELADDILSIVYAPGEREKTAQTLKAAKDAAFEQAANLLECEYAEDAKQKRRLDQIAQHIRDLKKRSS